MTDEGLQNNKVNEKKQSRVEIPTYENANTPKDRALVEPVDRYLKLQTDIAKLQSEISRRFEIAEKLGNPQAKELAMNKAKQMSVGSLAEIDFLIKRKPSLEADIMKYGGDPRDYTLQ